jgi:hypothetical protein
MLNNIINNILNNILNIDETKAKNGQKKILLLGDGFFARGFLHHINHNKFFITQIYRDSFINPQDIMFSLQRNKKYSPDSFLHIRDYFTKKPEEKINASIDSLDFQPSENAANTIHATNSTNLINVNPKINNQTIPGYDYIVVGLGSEKSLANWVDEINTKYVDYKSQNIAIVGMGPTGIELGTILSKKNNVTIFELFPKEKAIGFLSPKYKELLLNNFLNKKVISLFEKTFDGYANQDVNKIHKYYDNTIFCVGNKPNQLINKNIKVDNFLQAYNNVYIGGDCVNTGYIKTAQVAYQQGTYVAKRLNGDIPADQPFNFKPKGTLLNVGDKKVIVEGHNIVPDGVYPDVVSKLYSLFCI